MTQYASPNGDNVDGSWTNRTGGQGALNSNIRKDTGDGTYIVSEDTGSTDTCVFEIQNGDDPASDSDHIVRYRARSTDAMWMGVLPLTVSLYQDSLDPEDNPIWTNTNNSLATSLTDYSFTLSDPEAAKITDYDDLQLWFTRGTVMMGDNIHITEAYFEYPDASAPPAPAAVAKNQPEAFIMFVD
tara:strand:- start:11477 stop:12031 length:555 start_codon:yes stop_codon:yes gene_type:complete